MGVRIVGPIQWYGHYDGDVSGAGWTRQVWYEPYMFQLTSREIISWKITTYSFCISPYIIVDPCTLSRKTARYDNSEWEIDSFVYSINCCIHIETIIKH